MLVGDGERFGLVPTSFVGQGRQGCPADRKSGREGFSPSPIFPWD